MFLNPEQNVAKMKLREGMKVADLGAGPGLYARALSKRVGNNGKVYAVEVQKNLISHLQSELKRWNISNVECIWGDIERLGGTKIADKTMDAVVVSNVLFQVHDKLGFVDEIKRILKPKSQLLIIDWSESFGGMGPELGAVMSKSKTEELFSKKGFKIVENVSVGAHHYGIIMEYEK